MSVSPIIPTSIFFLIIMYFIKISQLKIQVYE